VFAEGRMAIFSDVNMLQSALVTVKMVIKTHV
jgi:hypothetical protein